MLTNYSVASARVAVVVLLTPLLLGAIALLLLGGEGLEVYGLAALLGLLLFALWWSVVRLTWSIRFAGDISVRSTRGVRRYAWDDLKHYRVRRVGSSFSRGRRYAFLVCFMRDGRRYEVGIPPHVVGQSLPDLLGELMQETDA